MKSIGQLIIFPMVAMWFSLLLAGLWSFFYILKTLQSNQKSNPSPPGPAGLPIIGHLHMLGDLPHRTLHSLSQIYGPTMGLRLGAVPAVVVSSDEASELFLKTHDLNFSSRPTSDFSDIISYGSRGLGFSQYGPYWRNLRRVCTLHLLSISKVNSYMSLRKDEHPNRISDCEKTPNEVSEHLILSSFTPGCPPGPIPDADFGEAPMILTVYVNGTKREIVAAVQKSGHAWALDRDNGTVVWSTLAGPGGLGGGGIWGAATEGKRVYTNIANVMQTNFTLAPSTKTTTASAWVAMEASTGQDSLVHCYSKK